MLMRHVRRGSSARTERWSGLRASRVGLTFCMQPSGGGGGIGSLQAK